MKKPIIALIVLVLAAAGSIVAFLAVKNKNDKKNQQKKEALAANVLFSFDSDSPTKLTFSKDGETYVCENKDGIWSIDLRRKRRIL